MTDEPQKIVLRCYADRVGTVWNAICVDLDIAAQGNSYEEVTATLEEMITSYIRMAMDAPEAERKALLARKAPLAVRIRHAVGFFVASLIANRGGSDKAGFISHRPAIA